MIVTLDGGPCSWPIDWGCCDVFETTAPAITGAAARAAIEVVWALGGRQHGSCTRTLRPCRRECADSRQGGSWPNPLVGGGTWINAGCGSCVGECSCRTISEVLLPGWVNAIEKVTIDGVDLDTDAYRLDNGRLLVRQDGEWWPLCQDLSKPAGQPGTWTVRASYGEPVPEIGQLAAGEMACEILRSLACDEGCRLPRNRLQTLVRQGVTEVYVDPNIFASNGGLTGLDLCDMYIRAYNPNRLTAPSVVMSPDLPMGRWTS